MRRSAEKICWEDLLRKSAEKICKLRWNAKFVRRRRNPLVVSCSSDVQKLRWNANRPGSSGNPLVVSCSSDVQNWGEMRILKLVLATLSSLRAGQMSETVVKWWFLYAACCPGLPALDSYIFAYAAVVKRGFWNVEWHAVVARRTFCFCWMNPLVGFGGSMARNCSETQISYGNFEEASHETLVLEACSVKFRGSLARNARFGSFVLWNMEEASRDTFVLESFVLWNMEEASRDTFVLEACSVKFGGSLARNAETLVLEAWFYEISRKLRTKRSFWKLVLWNFEEASRETFVLEACSLKFRGSLARNARFGSLFCEISRKPRTKRSFWKLCSVKYGGSLARHVRFGSFVLWNMEEASRDTFVLEACSLKFRGSLARNAETLVLEAWFYEI